MKLIRSKVKLQRVAAVAFTTCFAIFAHLKYVGNNEERSVFASCASPFPSESYIRVARHNREQSDPSVMERKVDTSQSGWFGYGKRDSLLVVS